MREPSSAGSRQSVAILRQMSHQVNQSDQNRREIPALAADPGRPRVSACWRPAGARAPQLFGRLPALTRPGSPDSATGAASAPRVIRRNRLPALTRPGSPDSATGVASAPRVLRGNAAKGSLLQRRLHLPAGGHFWLECGIVDRLVELDLEKCVVPRVFGPESALVLDRDRQAALFVECDHHVAVE
jgi:hypothetical protein